jgi:hypothetical protein
MSTNLRKNYQNCCILIRIKHIIFKHLSILYHRLFYKIEVYYFYWKDSGEMAKENLQKSILFSYIYQRFYFLMYICCSINHENDIHDQIKSLLIITI